MQLLGRWNWWFPPLGDPPARALAPLSPDSLDA
jgi:hypothetical protein